MDKVLTVVIPTYNMERYLRYCLDSLCVSRGGEALEVLVVNDGSKDTSSAIAHEYEQKHPGIFRVIDKENGNYGSCVNRGLAEAKGKYIKVLDADDSFDTENFECFIDFLCNTDADLVLSDFAVVDTERVVRKIIKYNLGEGTLFGMDDVCSTIVFKNMQMHAVTYRRKNLVDLSYKQTEGISYTDQQWIFIPMISVKSVARFDKVVYKYLVGRAGQTVDPNLKLKYANHSLRCALDMAIMYESYKNVFAGKAVQEYVEARVIPFLKNIYVFCLTNYNDETKKLLIDFDEKLKECCQYLYCLIGSKDISSFHNFEYIRYWREHKGINKTLLKLLSKVYLMILNMKKTSSEQDAMSVPVSF